MLTTTRNTTETAYEYDEQNRVTKRTVVYTENIDVPEAVYDADDEITTSVDMDSDAEVSLSEVFLTAAVGAVMGGLLFRAIRKD